MWGLALSALLVTGSAQAADVVVHGPSGCPDSAELGFRVERNVGMTLDQAPAMSFDVQLSRSASGYAGRLRAVTARDAESKERSFTGASCEELSDAIVVAIALALGAAEASSDRAPAVDDAPEGERGADGATQNAPAGALTSAAPGADAVVPAPPEESDERDAGWRPALSVAALVDVGSLPEPGLGAALGAELGWGRLRLRALGTLLFEQHTEVGTAAPLVPGADLRLVAGSLLGCSTALGSGALTLPLCLGIELGWVSGTGTNRAHMSSS